MLPIPKRLLIHNVSVTTPQEPNAWNDSTSSPPALLQFVRVEPYSKMVIDKTQAQLQLSAMLFYDCKNSLPKSFTFTEDMQIDFNGKNYKVHIIAPLYDGAVLHHIEVGLI